MNLTEMVNELARLRDEEANAVETLAVERDAWEIEHAELICRAKTARETAAHLEEQIRAATVEVFQITGDLKPAPGLGIRLVKRLVYDPGGALLWSIQNEQRFLALDKKAFDKYAIEPKNAVRLGFVQVRQEATATIATDLGKALAEGKQSKVIVSGNYRTVDDGMPF